MGEDITDTKAEPSDNETVTEEKKEEVIHDHPVFKTIADGDMETMRNYFEVEGVSLEKEDQHGMTPLMHASWKGKYDIAKYLIKQGKHFSSGFWIPNVCIFYLIMLALQLNNYQVLTLMEVTMSTTTLVSTLLVWLPRLTSALCY